MYKELIPIVLFLCLATVAVSFLFFHFKSKNKLQETLQFAIEKGQALSPETIDKLLNKKPPFADLKRGIILISFGTSVAIFGLFIPGIDDQATIFAGIGMIPMIVGIGYTIVWKLHSNFES